MEFQIQLFVREHHNGFFSLEVPGFSEFSVYGPDLDAAREELQLILSDRLERTHPRLLHRYETQKHREYRTFACEQALLVEEAQGEAPARGEISAFVSRDRHWQQVWFPRWDSHFWVRAKHDLEEKVEEFLTIHLMKKATSHERLSRRLEEREFEEWLTLEVEPARLEEFTGKHFGMDTKPVPAPKEKREGEEEEKPDKKKRPPTPTFERLGVKLSRLAREGDLEHAYGRSSEAEELFSLLQSRGRSSIVLVGPSGVGKTNLIYELVHKLRAPSTPKKLRERPVWFLDASRLVAGGGGFGEWQQQCLTVVQEAIEAEVIWSLGSLLPLLDAGKHEGSNQNVSQLLKPFLAGGRLTLVGECTTEQWAQLELREPSFARLFTPYRLEEPGQRERQDIVSKVAQDLRKETGVMLSEGGLQALLELSQRYQKPEHSLLGESLAFLRRLLTKASLQERERVDRSLVVSLFCSETGLPEFLIRDDLPLDPEAVRLTFQERLIGQEEAIARMVDLIAMIKAGLADLQRPLGSFLFVGPTGVGKTETAKTLAQFLFGDARKMIRFDMSEFLTPDSVHRFLGTAHEEGKLVSEIRRTPFCVLLLDEVEKAHSAVFDVLLQVLGEARLTDEAGRTADFRNCVVLMTSNLGVETLRQGVGFGAGGALQFREHFIAEAERFFRPEFFNRIDSVIPFGALHKEAIGKITDRELQKFLNREGISHQGLVLNLGEDVPEWLAKRGVNPKYGARPLKRVLERQLTAPLARHLSSLRGEAPPAIEVQVGEGSLRFKNLGQDAKDKRRGEAQKRLLGFLGEIGELRYQSHRWSKTGLFQELTKEVKLIGRLSQDRNFFRDREAAEARLKLYSQGAALVDEYTSLLEQLASLEDLAYELYYDRDAEPLETLGKELEEARGLLANLELRLYGRRFAQPNKATLFFQEGQSQGRALQRLLRCYVEICSHYGWSYRLFFSQRLTSEAALQEQWITEEEREVLLEKERASQQKSLQSDWEAVDSDSKKNKRKKSRNPLLKPKRSKSGLDLNSIEARCWRWKELNMEERNPLFHEFPEEKQIKELLAEAFVVGEEDCPKALVVEGAFAACLLAHETGAHLENTLASQSHIRVLFQNAAEVSLSTLEHPLEVKAQFSNDKLRVISQKRKTIYDAVVQLNQPLESRWTDVYHHMMRAHLYSEAFGRRGLRWFERQPRKKLSRKQASLEKQDAPKENVEETS